MNQETIGRFIAKKRTEKNLSQMQLAEKIGVSNKTISKWETGKCMPDYSIIKDLCNALGITIAELLDGEEKEDNSIRVYDDDQIMNLIKRIQVLEQQKITFYGVLLIVIGIAVSAVSKDFGGTNFTDFLSGLFSGISIGVMLLGVFLASYSLAKKAK